MSNQPKHDKMMRAFTAFQKRIATRYQEAHDALERGEYQQAYDILAALAVSHARTSMSLRSFMIRNKLMPEDE